MPGSIPSISGEPPLPLCFPNECNNCSDTEKLAVFMNFFCILDSSVGKEFACSAGDPGSIPGLERSPRERIVYPLQYSWASLVAQLVKNPPAMQETWVQSLGWDDPWRRESLPTPIFLPGEFHGLQSMGLQRVGQDWATFTFFCSYQASTHLRSSSTLEYELSRLIWEIHGTEESIWIWCQRQHFYCGGELKEIKNQQNAWGDTESVSEKSKVLVGQSCPMLCDTMDCSPPSSSVHGISKARMLEWAAISFSRGSSWPSDRTQVSHTVGRQFTLCTTREEKHLE